jgi:hypothetical protein
MDPNHTTAKKPGILLFSLVFMSSQSCNNISYTYRKKKLKIHLARRPIRTVYVRVLAMNNPKQNPLNRRRRVYPLLYI